MGKKSRGFRLAASTVAFWAAGCHLFDQELSDEVAPRESSLLIHYPAAGASVLSDHTSVHGEVTGNRQIAGVRVGGIDAAYDSRTGRFAVRVPVRIGENQLSVSHIALEGVVIDEPDLEIKRVQGVFPHIDALAVGPDGTEIFAIGACGISSLETCFWAVDARTQAVRDVGRFDVFDGSTPQQLEIDAHSGDLYVTTASDASNAQVLYRLARSGEVPERVAELAPPFESAVCALDSENRRVACTNGSRVDIETGEVTQHAYAETLPGARLLIVDETYAWTVDDEGLHLVDLEAGEAVNWTEGILPPEGLSLLAQVGSGGALYALDPSGLRLWVAPSPDAPIAPGPNLRNPSGEQLASDLGDLVFVPSLAKLVAVSASRGELVVIDPETGEVEPLIANRRGLGPRTLAGVRAAHLSPDGSKVVSVGRDGAVSDIRLIDGDRHTVANVWEHLGQEDEGRVVHLKDVVVTSRAQDPALVLIENSRAPAADLHIIVANTLEHSLSLPDGQFSYFGEDVDHASIACAPAADTCAVLYSADTPDSGHKLALLNVTTGTFTETEIALPGQVSSHARLWLAADGRSLTHFDDTTFSWVHLETGAIQELFSLEASTRSVAPIAVEEDGLLSVFYRGHAWRINLSDGSFEAQETLAEALPFSDFVFVGPSRGTRFLARYHDHTLVEVDPVFGSMVIISR